MIGANCETQRLRSYECNVKGRNWNQTIHAPTPGKAKYEYWRDLREAWPDIPFTAVRVLRVGPPQTSDSFRYTAEYRAVPFARVGMAVQVGDERGVIVGENSSANFNVLFGAGKYAGLTLNCHPNHEIVYFGADGEVLADYRRRRP